MYDTGNGTSNGTVTVRVRLGYDTRLVVSPILFFFYLALDPSASKYRVQCPLKPIRPMIPKNAAGAPQKH